VTMDDESGIAIRPRTGAFPWDKELFWQWNRKGACWLDHHPGDDDNNDTGNGRNAEVGKQDEGGSSGEGVSDASGCNVPIGNGSLAALQHVFSSFAAHAANETGTPGAPDSSKEPYNNYSVLKESHLQQNRNYVAKKNATMQEPGTVPDQCIYTAETAANENGSLQIAVKSDNRISNSAPIVSSNCCKCAEKMLQTTPPAANTIESSGHATTTTRLPGTENPVLCLGKGGCIVRGEADT
jgi:hypothetical protein